MSECARYEIAIERRRRGALEPEAASELQAHVATCARCGAYAADRSGALLAALAGPAPDADALRQKVQGQAAALRRGVAWSIAGLAACLFGLAWFATWGARGEPAVVFGGLTLAAATMAWATRQLRARAGVAEQARAEGELMTIWRSALDEQIRTARFGGPAVSLGAFLMWGGALAITGPDNRKALALLAVALLVSGFSLYERLVTLPRLTRERDALDRGAP